MKRIQTVYQESFHWLKSNLFQLLFAYFLCFGVGVCFSLLQQIGYTLSKVDYFQPDFSVNLSWPALALTLGLAAVMFFAVTPLWCGVKKWVYLRCKGQPAELSVLFDYYVGFKVYAKALRVQFGLWYRKVFCFLCFWTPLFLLYTLLQYAVTQEQREANLWYLIAMFLLVVAFFITGIVSVYILLRYFLTFYLWVEHPQCPVQHLFRVSVQRMHVYRSEVFRLYLSMIPLGLLCIFILPILFILPYYQVLLSIEAMLLIQETEM